MATIKRFEDLECWQEAQRLVGLVYGLTGKALFKKDHELVRQVRASAVSSMANIAEGFQRKSAKDFMKFLDYSRASVAETVSHCHVALDQHYIESSEMDRVQMQADLVGKKVNSFITYLNKSSNSRHTSSHPPKATAANPTSLTSETSPTSLTSSTSSASPTNQTSKTSKTNSTSSTSQTNPLIPYSRQYLGEDDIAAVCQVLRSDWLTTGPKVAEFEEAVANYVGAKHAVAFSSGTAALHATMYATGIGAGDEAIVPPMTFAATANCVVFQGGTPVFADVEPDTLLIDPTEVEKKITKSTKAVIAVDYAGHPCDYNRLRDITETHSLKLVADSCHALGAEYKGKTVGSLADMTVFSFHPVKHITTGEGGMVTTDDESMAARLRLFRNHGIETDYRQREKLCSWYYEMVDLGYNYRITDIQCALGISQLRKLPGFLERRRAIARRYDEAFQSMPDIRPLEVRPDVRHAYHLYVVRVPDRDRIFAELRRAGIGVNVHYIPVHLHPYYRRRFVTGAGLCPVAEQAYMHIISLPIFVSMTGGEVEEILAAIAR